MRHLFLTLALCTLGAAAAQSTAQEAKANRPNVLFISVDDLRPELGCYGNPVVKTPNIDRLASRGTLFSRAYCQQAVCSPSRTSLMTGRRPDATQVYDLETHFRVALPDTVTLPQHFKANGYHCAALNKIYHHGFEDGRSWSEPHWYPNGQTVDTDPVDWTKRVVKRVGPGTREFEQGPPPADNDKAAGVKPGTPQKALAFQASPKSDDELPDGFTAAEAVRRLHELKSKGQPFFLAVGFLKPHLPFVSPKKYWDLYDPDKIPAPTTDQLPDGAPAFAGHTNGELHSYGNIPPGNPVPAELAKQLRHGYYAAVSYTDAQVGRLLDALEKEGLARNTVVVLWGDHGWQLGEHGLWQKHTNFELATRAPLILSAPRQEAAGKKCEAPVEFVDIYPTLADACGLPIPAGLDGKSLKPLLDNPASVPPGKVAISQYPRGGAQTGNRQLMGYSIRDSRWRLTLWRDRKTQEIAATELYDELNDPAETVNVADRPEHRKTIESLSRHLPPPVALAAAPAKPVPAKPKIDREALFQRKDRNGDGKLTREEFLANQPDPEAAKGRWDTWDLDKDGFLSRDEFVFQGQKKPGSK
ncbi:MAG: betC 4 [Armatimonadetes bacterium]|nr:betC 4 [Armatimonadota bacterium]